MVTIDFKSVGKNDSGIYYPDSERIIIYLSNHESLTDICKTIQHELIHHAINKCEEDMDEDQEERLIFCMSWAEEYTM